MLISNKLLLSLVSFCMTAMAVSKAMTVNFTEGDTSKFIGYEIALEEGTVTRASGEVSSFSRLGVNEVCQRLQYFVSRSITSPIKLHVIERIIHDGGFGNMEGFDTFAYDVAGCTNLRCHNKNIVDSDGSCVNTLPKNWKSNQGLLRSIFDKARKHHEEKAKERKEQKGN